VSEGVKITTFTKYIIMIVLVIALGVIVFFIGKNGKKAGFNERVVDSINWEKTYDSNSKHPFGTYFIHSLLEKGLEDHSVYDMDFPVESYFDSISLQLNEDYITYFFVGKSLNLYDKEVDSLLRFVERGHTMFVAAEFLPERLLSKLFYNVRDYNYFGYSSNSSISLTFEDDRFGDVFDIVNQIDDKSQTQRWYNINYGIEYELQGRVIGKSGYRPCYVQFKHGNGKILIHTIPQVFTNSYLSSDLGREYVEIVLSYFSNSTVLFDNYTQYAYDNGNMDIDQSRSNGRNLRDFKTLNFLLSNQSLRWAYFILLTGILFFVVFTGKRQQKIMPTIYSNDNSSLEFTETIARLYLKQNQHNKLIVHMENIFKNRIKSRYYIAYSEESTYIKRISQKSGVDESEIKQLMKLFKVSSNLNSVSDDYLVNLYKKLNNFYAKAK